MWICFLFNEILFSVNSVIKDLFVFIELLSSNIFSKSVQKQYPYKYHTDTIIMLITIINSNQNIFLITNGPTITKNAIAKCNNLTK